VFGCGTWLLRIDGPESAHGHSRTLFSAPKEGDWITVKDVLEAALGELQNGKIYNWVQSVWDCWETQHEWIRKKATEIIGSQY